MQCCPSHTDFMNRNSWDTKTLICSKYSSPLPRFPILGFIQSLRSSVLYKGHKKLPYPLGRDNCAQSIAITAGELGDPNTNHRSAAGWTGSRSYGRGDVRIFLQRAGELLLMESHFWRPTRWCLLVPSDVQRLLWKWLPVPLPYWVNQMSKGWGGMKKLIHLPEHAGEGTDFTACRCPVVQVKRYWKREGVSILTKVRKQPLTQRSPGSCKLALFWNTLKTVKLSPFHVYYFANFQLGSANIPEKRAS